MEKGYDKLIGKFDLTKDADANYQTIFRELVNMFKRDSARDWESSHNKAIL